MFGKREWFRRQALAWSVVPAKWQGWVYAAAWSAGISMPTLLLLARHQPLEAGTWLVLSLVALAYEIRQMATRAPKSPAAAATGTNRAMDAEVLYIRDTVKRAI